MEFGACADASARRHAACQVATLVVSDFTQRRIVLAKRALGFIALAVCAWFAVSYFRGLRNLGYLDSAIGSVRTLVAAETKYSESRPDVGYTCTVSKLGEGQLFRTLAKTGIWNGYAFEVTGCNASKGAAPNRTYQITARPLIPRMPAVCSDQSGVVKTDESGSIQRCIAAGTSL